MSDKPAYVARLVDFGVVVEMRECELALAVEQIPDANGRRAPRPRRRTRQPMRRVVEHLESGDRLRIARVQREHTLIGGRVRVQLLPQFDGAIARAAGEHVAIAADEAQGGHRARVSLERHNALIASVAPQFDGVVGRGARQQAARGQQLQGVDDVGVSGEEARAHAALGVPHADRVIGRGAGEQ